MVGWVDNSDNNEKLEPWMTDCEAVDKKAADVQRKTKEETVGRLASLCDHHKTGLIFSIARGETLHWFG
jgi:hypothetical protein